jgi:hypothetical protein
LSSRERRKGITPSAAYLSESSVSRKLTIISYGEQILEVLDSGIFGELVRRIEHRPLTTAKSSVIKPPKCGSPYAH